MENIDCEILADSLNPVDGSRLTSLLFKRFPYSLIQEAGTHRSLNPGSTFEQLNVTGPDFSRSSASSRAIPVEKMILAIQRDPYIPSWTSHKPGMRGGPTTMEQAVHLSNLHMKTMEMAISHARYAVDLEAHKEVANFYLKPYLRIPFLATATNKGWQNFFRLRCSNDAHPDFQEQAISAKKLFDSSIPVKLQIDEWHMPFCDKFIDGIETEELLQIGPARVARLSYNSHNGDYCIDKQKKLTRKLLESGHMGPFEHFAQVTGISMGPSYSRNFGGAWLQLRAKMEGIANFFGLALEDN